LHLESPTPIFPGFKVWFKRWKIKTNKEKPPTQAVDDQSQHDDAAQGHQPARDNSTNNHTPKISSSSSSISSSSSSSSSSNSGNYNSIDNPRNDLDSDTPTGITIRTDHDDRNENHQQFHSITRNLQTNHPPITTQTPILTWTMTITTTATDKATNLVND
jgi:hypothetical protein